MTFNLDKQPERLVVSRKTAAEVLDCSKDHVDDLVRRGDLVKIPLGPKKVGISWPSILKLAQVDEGA